MQKKSSPPCKKSAAASSRTLCGALRRQRLRKVHTATVHQRINPPVLRGRAKRLLPPRMGRTPPEYGIGEIGELAASVFQDPRSQFFTVNSSNEVAFGLENHGLPQDKIRRRVDEAFRIFHLERLKDRMSTSCPAASDSSSPSCPRGQWTQIFFCWMSPRPIWTLQPRSS